MARSIRSYDPKDRSAVISRRLKSDTKGLGYWAAVDAQRQLRAQTKSAGKAA